MKLLYQLEPHRASSPLDSKPMITGLSHPRRGSGLYPQKRLKVLRCPHNPCAFTTHILLRRRQNMTDSIQAGEISGTYRPPNHSSITGGTLPRKRTQARAKAAGRTPAKPGALPVRSMPALRGRCKMGDDLQSEVRRPQLLQGPASTALFCAELVSASEPVA